MTDTTVQRPPEPIRCGWVGNKAHFVPYHDEEWGVPVHDDRRHFEMLILEGAQSGLSWSIILLRREGYRRAFAGFDPQKVAKFGARKTAALLKDTGIIRNRLKIESAITNAKAFLHIQQEYGSFDRYIWQFVNHVQKINHWETLSQVPATTPESDALSKDLKQRGFRFVGSTVMYAHMQAAGLVNDHTTDCFRHPSNSPLSLPSESPVRSHPHPSPRIGLKRIYDPPHPNDGMRILVDRLWPRGLSKKAARVDLWLKDLAPSSSLRSWFGHDPVRWDEFRRRYARELERHPQALEKIRRYAQEKSITLLYGARNQDCNHAVALHSYLR